MKNQTIERLADQVIARMLAQTVEIEASGRHVHLSREAVDILFGEGHKLTKKSDLSQPGQFACQERIAVEGPKHTLKNVIVLGPERAETQVEISKTDALVLGIDAPIRMSGAIEATPGAKLIGPAGTLNLTQGVIIAKRHIHMTLEDAVRFGVVDQEEVDVIVDSKRAITFHQVAIRVSPSFATYMHIDYDEANASGHYKGIRGRICKINRGYGYGR